MTSFLIKHPHFYNLRMIIMYTGILSLDGSIISVDYKMGDEEFYVPLENEDEIVIENRKGEVLVKGAYEKFADSLSGFLVTETPSDNPKMLDRALVDLFKEEGVRATVSRPRVNALLEDYVKSLTP